jgi:hypothetical protein
MPKKYVKRRIVIEAVQYTDPDSVRVIMKMHGKTSGINNSEDGLFIHTLEGTMRAKKGDYIIKGVRGELYPCDKEIFEDTYEEVDCD